MNQFKEAVFALTVASWRGRWNQLVRFNRIRLGVWLVIGQVAAALFLLYRLNGSALSLWSGRSMATPFLLMASQAAVSSFLGAIMKGQDRLYGAKILPLIHVSPATPISVIAAQVGEGLPGRVGLSALIAIVTAVLLPPTARVWGVPSLWIIGIVCGLIGQLAGLWILIVWVRMAPQALRVTWLLTLTVQVALVWYVVYLLVTGASVTQLQGIVYGIRWWLVGSLILLFGVPGLIMGLYLVVAPRRAGDMYRHSWLNLKEMVESGRPLRSRWPSLLPGQVGAIQAKEWLQMGRNPFTLLHTLLGCAALVGLLLAGPAISRLSPVREQMWVQGMGIGLAQAVYGQVLAVIPSVDGPNIALHVLAGVRAQQFLAGKFLAGLPFVLISALCTWVAAMGAHEPLGLQARNAAVAAVIGIGMVIVHIGMASLDAALRDPGDRPESETAAAVLEQVPTGIGGALGFVLSTAFGGISVWMLSRGDQVSLGMFAVAGASALLTLIPGYFRLRSLLNGVR